ncbi:MULTISPECIES: hypothetical protein [Lactiplantibacillus]|uniref:hypothetical protein n=2 Tax=Lactiplantibacillus TaxID=2767842 RepID=UPI001585F77D|nr:MULTISPECIES: hypothetical protein [Lactiplantibacillus]WNN86525.1 hypothetical protein RNT80_06410 [Lactiplantibacillus pentosus]
MMIESKILKKAFQVHEKIKHLGTDEDMINSADMLGNIVKVISENVMLRRQLEYTKFIKKK